METTLQTVEENHGTLDNPPGSLIIWIFIGLELLTFGGGFVFYLLDRANNIEAFRLAQKTLNRDIAAINTVLLITSGFVIAQGVIARKQRLFRKAGKLFYFGAILGFGFLGLKTFEFSAKLASGWGLGSSDFFNYYWLFTGFHYLHVLVGVAVLFFIAFNLSTDKIFPESDLSVTMGATFWHLCDLIWIVLFPLLYILI